MVETVGNTLVTPSLPGPIHSIIMADFEDKELTCRDCGKPFIWTAGEQEFYASKGFSNPPARCPDDRKKAKEQRNSERVMYQITCANCGKPGEVPFKPQNPEGLLCADCFKEKRAQAA